ncbi:ArnT family glycosyltransferase [Chloroflexota bacterium]
MTGNKGQQLTLRRVYLSTTIRLAILALLATSAVLLVSLQTLTAYPRVHVDEPWNADRAWNRLQTGDNYTTMDIGPFPSGSGIGTPPIASGILVWSYSFLGLGVFQTRLPSLAFGGILLLATYSAGSLLYKPQSGLLALLLLALSWPFLEASRRGRPDIIVAALVMAAFCFALWGMRSGKLLPNLVAGVLITLSVAVHQNGIVFVLTLVIVYVAFYGPGFWRRREVWAFLAGCALGSLYPGGVARLAGGILGYVLPGQTGGSQSVVDLGTTHAPPVLALDAFELFLSLLREVRRYRVSDHGLEVALIVASLLFLFVRRSRGDRLLLTFVGSAFALFVLLIYNKEEYYAILFYPFFLLAAAEMFVSLLGEPVGARLQRLFATTLLVLFFFSSVMHYAVSILSHFDYDYYAITDRLRAVIPEGARVVARPTWWLGLTEYDYRSLYSLGYYDLDSDFDLTGVLEQVRPDVVIVDDEVRELHLVDYGEFTRGPGLYRFYKYSRQEFEDFLAQRGEILLAFTDPWHGLIEVYGIRWD